MHVAKKLFLLTSIFALCFVLEAGEAKAWVDISFGGIKVVPSSPAINQDTIITIKVGVGTDETITDDGWANSYSYSVENFDKKSITPPLVDSSHPVKNGSAVYYTIKGSFNKTGTQKIIFRANDDEIIDETKMSNNNGTAEVVIQKAHNITPTKISVYPPNPFPNQDCAITITLKNNGIMPLKEDPGYDLFFDDFRKGKTEHEYIMSYNSLPVGEETTYIINGIFLSEGEKNMQIDFDVDKKLDESNEDDNSISFTPLIVGEDQVDLMVESIEFSEKTLVLNQDVEINVQLKNVGLVSIDIRDGFAIEDDNFSFPGFKMKDIYHTDYPSTDNLLEPDEYVTYSFFGRFEQAGEKKIWFHFNEKENIFELDYDNNYLEDDILVYSSMDQVNDFELLSHKIEYLDASTAIISWKTSKEATGKLNIKMHDVSTQEDVYNTKEGLDHTITLIDLVDLKKYFYSIEVLRGDKSNKTDYIEFHSLPSDNAIISGGPKYRIVASSSTFTWHTNMLADTCVYYKAGEQSDYTEKCTVGSAMDHEILLENLADGRYKYYVTSQSETGDNMPSPIGEFEIKQVVSIDEIYTQPTTPVEPQDTGKTTPETNTTTDRNKDILNIDLYRRLKGKILIKVEDEGRAYYVNPQKETRHYLGRPEDAFSVMREQGVGISTANLEKIEIAKTSGGADTDGDGLSDMLEDAIGTDKTKIDTDSDGYSDGDELNGGYNPKGDGKIIADNNFTTTHVGKIFLQVEGKGEAWYINPADSKRYFLGRPADAFNVMRNLGLGISNGDFDSL